MLYGAVCEVARARPNARAITTTDGPSVSYAELVELVDRVTGGLRARGIGEDQVVACSLCNQIGYVALILALARLGSRYVPIMGSFDAEEITEARRGARPALVVVDGDRALPAGASEPVRLDALCASGPDSPRKSGVEYTGLFRMLWTSGSTGFPKQVAWRQDKFITERRRWLADTGITTEDVFLCRHTLDVAHATDLHVFAALLSGAELVLADPGESPLDLLRHVEKHGVTVMSVLPRHYEQFIELAEQGYRFDLSRLRRPLCGGAYLSQAMMRRAAEVLKINLRQIYGSTEFGLALGNMTDALQADLGMVAVHGVGTRVEPFALERPDLGELVLVSDCTSEGYVDNDAANARTFRGGDFWTGDVALRTDDGSYRILGRVAEALRTPDAPVLAPVLDEWILETCAVAESVCLPVHLDEYRDEVFVVVRPADGASAGEVECSVRAAVERHGLTATVHAVDDIPHTPVGKVDKPAIRYQWELGTTHG